MGAWYRDGMRTSSPREQVGIRKGSGENPITYKMKNSVLNWEITPGNTMKSRTKRQSLKKKFTVPTPDFWALWEFKRKNGGVGIQMNCKKTPRVKGHMSPNSNSPNAQEVSGKVQGRGIETTGKETVFKIWGRQKENKTNCQLSIFNCRLKLCSPQEMAQLVKCFPHNWEDLSCTTRTLV